MCSSDLFYQTIKGVASVVRMLFYAFISTVSLYSKSSFLLLHGRESKRVPYQERTIWFLWSPCLRFLELHLQRRKWNSLWIFFFLSRLLFYINFPLDYCFFLFVSCFHTYTNFLGHYSSTFFLVVKPKSRKNLLMITFKCEGRWVNWPTRQIGLLQKSC